MRKIIRVSDIANIVGGDGIIDVYFGLIKPVKYCSHCNKNYEGDIVSLVNRCECSSFLELQKIKHFISSVKNRMEVYNRGGEPKIFGFVDNNIMDYVNINNINYIEINCIKNGEKITEEYFVV